MIYSVFEDYRYAFIGYIAIAVVLAMAMLYIILPFIVKTFRKKVNRREILPEVIVRSVGIAIILLILCLRVVPDISHMSTARKKYETQSCNILIGTIHDVEIEYYGGRNESYDVSFFINDVKFEEAIHTDKEKAERIKEHEGDTVRFSYGSMSEPMYAYTIEVTEQN